METATPKRDRPQRWDASFDPAFEEADVDRLLRLAPFSEMNPDNFPKRISIRDILKHDTRLRRFRKGEIVVRQGDHGTSAFMVISGDVSVVISPDLPASVLGRRERHRKGLFRILAQAWNFRRPPESVSRSQLKQEGRVSARVGQNDEVRIFLQDIPRVLDQHRTALLRPGDFFGEIAALSRMPRTASIFATGEAELLEIRWQGLRDLMKYDPGLRQHIDEIYRAHALESHLREIPIFGHLNDEDLKKVMEKTEFATYGDYEWSGEYKRMAAAGAVTPSKEPLMAEEGEYPNGMILIRAGFARLSRKYGNGLKTLNYLGAGQNFGLLEIVHNWKNPGNTVPLQYSLRSVGYTHALFIPTHVLEEVVLPKVPVSELPPPVQHFEETEIDKDPADIGARIGSDLMEFLTENRLFNGTASMVIDLDRCTRCDDCVRACASAHSNNPRFLRHGPVSGKVMVANACMHCADPVCMIGCPTGAIHRDSFGGQVVINPKTCIGCKACYNNCPYDAIRMVELRDGRGEFLLDQEFKPILKATKCDLCVDQWGGPACQRACPHDALKRINLNNLDALANWLKR